MKDINAVVKQLKVDEGFRKHPYKCSEGKTTIGYGWNLDDLGISKELAERVLIEQAKGCELSCEIRFDSFWDNLSNERQGVLVNMCFNIGINRLMGFKKMIAALKNYDYLEAALQMIDSKWHSQVGPRAIRLVNIMRGGVTK